MWLDEDQPEFVEKLKMEILEERRNALGEHRGRGDEVRGSRMKDMSRKKNTKSSCNFGQNQVRGSSLGLHLASTQL